VKKNIFSFIIILGEAVFLLWIGGNAMQKNIPDTMNYGRLSEGIFLLIIAITSFIYLIFKIKDTKILYANIMIGFLIFLTGLSIKDNSWMSSSVAVPGMLLIFINYPVLLKKKIPKDQDLRFKGFLLAGLIFVLIMIFIYLFAYLIK